jgi:hypothetical protein
MKKITVFYLVYVIALGVFSGLLVSFGSHIIESMLVMTLFWGLMLTPILSIKD